MDELRNLQQMASLASGRFNQYDGEDFVLPQIFKEQVTEINSNTITYNKYSAIIETRGNQHGILNIFMPNQWFYIASYFTDFYNELQKYKRYALQVTSKERLKELNGGELTATELSTLHRLTLDDKSMGYLLRFITDYSWWGGAKTIDRGDFYVSPILSNANLVNASQSFVADLCAFLADKQNLVRAIINKEESGSPINARTLLFQPCIESKEGINGFLDRAIPIVLERDADLYRLDKFANVDGGVYLTIGRHNLGRASDKDARPNDINPNIEWTCGLNGKRYYLNREVNYPNFVTFQEAFNEAYKGIFEIVIDTIDYNGAQRKRYSLYAVNSAVAPTDIEDSPYRPYLTALRTKPFLLLAGISGTGKSRIVKEMAFASCPDVAELRKDPVSPGNYLLVEVKPNWHDSTELLGYESTIKKGYVLTPFVKFLYKAMKHPDVPFFVCLDEMNLAPVEQYFAEFLSILESRKQQADGTILTEPLISAEVFKKYPELCAELNGRAVRRESTTANGTYQTFDPTEGYIPLEAEYKVLCEEGLRIPQNVVVIGTVNMDETTHQFSRKVIDRAMTIEMNEVKFDGFFESSNELSYADSVLPKEYFLPCYTTAGKALESVPDDAEHIKANVPALLEQLNEALADTPFKIAYRVQNELVLYFAALRQEEVHKANGTAELLATAMDQILMMKVLPRIEGDDELLEEPLERLAVYAEGYPMASAKIKEMQERLGRSHFTSFWP